MVLNHIKVSFFLFGEKLFSGERWREYMLYRMFIFYVVGILLRCILTDIVKMK